ncbi:MAG TPA: Gfo/Idh/MocA family oxidoreductase [Polyangiaceae bacterium]|nr:Gfo/Idh/MocA family oxidoreductase [Polyangiaceae bacterium]
MIKSAPAASNARLLGIAVVGAGRWGKNLVRVFGSLDTARLVSVCDRDVARLADLRTNTDRVLDHSSVLTDPRVHAVVIATPPTTHSDLAVAAIEAGKHVFIEKPMALSTEHATRIIRAANLHGRRGMVGFVLHYHPAIEELRRWIVRGTLGSVSQVLCMRHNTPRDSDEGSPWWSLGPHDINVARFLLGAEPESIALVTCIDDDVATLRGRLHFSSGCVAEISVASAASKKVRRLVVAGTRGVAVFDDQKPDRKLTLLDSRLVSLDELDKGELPHRHCSPRLAPELPLVEPLRVEAAHFVHAVSNGTPFQTDIAEGARVVAILEAGEASLSAGGRPISLRRVLALPRTPVHVEPTSTGNGSRIA